MQFWGGPGLFNASAQGMYGSLPEPVYTLPSEAQAVLCWCDIMRRNPSDYFAWSGISPSLSSLASGAWLSPPFRHLRTASCTSACATRVAGKGQNQCLIKYLQLKEPVIPYKGVPSSHTEACDQRMVSPEGHSLSEGT